jgi:regulator of RNase E activity RraA
MKKQPLGKLPADAFGMLELPAIAADILDGFRALPDLTGMSSDAMDELGIDGVIPASVLKPTEPKARLVGRALTLLNVAAASSVPDAVATGVSGMAEIEAHNLAEPGDVLVLQGLDQVSNMGGMSASIGHRQGQLGAIVDGAVRDVDHGRDIGYAIWSRSVSPITGKWRVKTLAVNKPVSICGIAVNPGDLVLADETGVCFIPRQRAGEVLERARRIAANEVTRTAKIASGAPVAELLPPKKK